MSLTICTIDLHSEPHLSRLALPAGRLRVVLHLHKIFTSKFFLSWQIFIFFICISQCFILRPTHINLKCIKVCCEDDTVFHSNYYRSISWLDLNKLIQRYSSVLRFIISSTTWLYYLLAYYAWENAGQDSCDIDTFNVVISPSTAVSGLISLQTFQCHLKLLAFYE